MDLRRLKPGLVISKNGFRCTKTYQEGDVCDIVAVNRDASEHQMVNSVVVYNRRSDRKRRMDYPQWMGLKERFDIVKNPEVEVFAWVKKVRLHAKRAAR